MDDAQTGLTLGPAILNLVPVVVGGLLATLGVVAGAIVVHKLERKTSDARLKREKLEQLVDASYRVESWLNERMSVDLSGHERDIGILPISEVEMISRLYFPELQKEVYRLSVASASYQKWIAEGRVTWTFSNWRALSRVIARSSPATFSPPKCFSAAHNPAGRHGKAGNPRRASAVPSSCGKHW